MAKRQSTKPDDSGDLPAAAFKVGDPIVHPSHGAGRIIAIQTWEVAGVSRQYYSIELISDHGTLNIPVDQADASGLRRAVSDPDHIFDVLSEEPATLNSDHRKRQSDLADKIHSGDAGQITEALRDLAYREQISGLTERDQRLKSEAEGMLIGELALQPDLNLDSAAARLQIEVHDAIEEHVPDDEEDDA